MCLGAFAAHAVSGHLGASLGAAEAGKRAPTSSGCVSVKQSNSASCDAFCGAGITGLVRGGPVDERDAIALHVLDGVWT